MMALYASMKTSKGRALQHKERGQQARGAFGLLEPVHPKPRNHARTGYANSFKRTAPQPIASSSLELRRRGAKLRRGSTRNAPRPFLFRLQINDVHLSILRAEYVQTLQRVAKRTKINGECWEWLGAKRYGGYGVILHNGRLVGIHRLSLAAIGHRLDGLEACHKCDNPACWRPSHLFPGTRADNQNDAIAKGRAVLPPRTDWASKMQKERHHWQKLSRDDIPPIRKRIAKGESMASIGRAYGVAYTTIIKIRNGERWAHVK